MEKILEIARKSSELGVELFVLDDGWFSEAEIMITVVWETGEEI